MTDVRAKWEAFLSPDILRGRLISASLYLAAFEILRDSIVERLKDFYSIGFNEKGSVIPETYKKEVTSRNTSRVYASLDWLKEHEAITDSDLKAYENIKECRNAVAHELPKIVAGESGVDYIGTFAVMVALIRKIEVWWVVNVELATDPEWADKEVNEDEITPGPMITLQLMLDIALGAPEKANYYLDEFTKRGQKP